MLTDLERVAAVERAVPEEGLFAEKDWLVSPTALPLTAKFVDELDRLGYRLWLFVRACNLLYQQSVKGRQPAWIADYLDRGKPEELREISRAREFRDELPRVLRPDLVLTESGYTIAELDNVPGGIGLTAWLNQTYAALGEDVIGGAAGMIEGFRSILPGGADILVSEEAATYRPEMQWLARQAGEGYAVRDATSRPDRDAWKTPRNVYRFFELFDLAEYPRHGGADAACAGGSCARDAAIQAVPRGEDVVRAVLAASAAGFLAAGADGAAFSQTAGGDSVHLADGPRAAAAARGDPAPGDSRLGGAKAFQPEAARVDPEDQRILGDRVGQPRRRAGHRPAARGMGGVDPAGAR